VDDTQLSLAIGKKGQNVRLAAKLLGWKIDIKSEEEKRQEVEQQMQGFGAGTVTAIEQVTELGEGIIQKLVTAGITTVEALADMTPEQLEEIPGIGEKTLEKISTAVRHYFGQYEPGEERPEPVASAEGGEENIAAEKAASDASLEEEEDALKQDLTQEGEEPPAKDGTGLVNDDVAAEQIEEVTETGPAIEDEGAEPVAPGRDDTSEKLEENAVTDQDVAQTAELQEESDRKPEGGA